MYPSYNGGQERPVQRRHRRHPQHLQQQRPARRRRLRRRRGQQHRRDGHEPQLAHRPASLTALVTNLDITTTSDVDYYTFTAPAGAAGTMTVQVQSQGLSLLSPKVTVYAADGIDRPRHRARA